MIPGTILFDPNFIFRDGETKPKYLIVLTDGSAGYYLIAKTTSNGNHRGLHNGCQIGDRFPSFFLPPGCCHFPLPTWVCLEEFYPFNARVLNDRLIQGSMHREAILPDDLTIVLLRCVSACPDITDAQADEIDQVLARIDPQN